MPETSRHRGLQDNQNKAHCESFYSSQMHRSEGREDLLSRKAVSHQPAKPLGTETVLTDWIIQPVDDFSAVCLVGRRLLACSNEEYWHSSAIVKRISAQRYQTASGVIYVLDGCINAEDARVEACFSWSMIKTFADGFPEDWKPLIHKYLTVQKEKWKNNTREPTPLRDKQVHRLAPPVTSQKPFRVAERMRDAAMMNTENYKQLITPCLVLLHTVQFKQPGEDKIVDGKVDSILPSQKPDIAKQTLGKKASTSSDTAKMQPHKKLTMKRSEVIHKEKDKTYGERQARQSSRTKNSAARTKSNGGRFEKSLCSPELSPQFLPASHNSSSKDDFQKSNASARMSVRYRSDIEDKPVEISKKDDDLNSSLYIQSSRQKRRKGNRNTTSSMRSHASKDTFNKENADKAPLERKGLKEAEVLKKHPSVSACVRKTKDDHEHRDYKGKPASKNSKVKTQKRVIKGSKSKTRGVFRKPKSSNQAKKGSPAEWSKEELERLYSVVDSFPKKKAILWKQVSDAVGWRTADECRKRYQLGCKRPPSAQLKPPAKVSDKLKEKAKNPMQITAKAGTLKRKRQVHEYLDNAIKDDYSDPFASKSSPIYVGKKILIPSVKAMKIGELGHLQTPGGATPKSPFSMSFGALVNNHISPGMLEPVHRDEADQYIYRMQRKKLGSNWGNIHLNKKVCTEDTRNRVTTATNMFNTSKAAVPTLASNGIQIEDNLSERNLDNDSDEEEDYYFSD